MGNSDNKARRDAENKQEEMQQEIDKEKALNTQKKKDAANKEAEIMKRRFSLLNAINKDFADKKSATLG